MTTKIRHLVMDVGLAPDQSSVLLDMVYGWLDDVAATYGSRLGELPPTTQKALSTRQDVQVTVTKLLNLAEDISVKEGNLKRAREATLSKVMAQADSKLSPEGLQAMRDDSEAKLQAWATGKMASLVAERDELTRAMTLAQQSLDDLILNMAEDVGKELGPAPCELKADELQRDLEALELAELEKLLGPQLRDGSVEALPETKPTELEATEPQQEPVPKKPTELKALELRQQEPVPKKPTELEALECRQQEPVPKKPTELEALECRQQEPVPKKKPTELEALELRQQEPVPKKKPTELEALERQQEPVPVPNKLTTELEAPERRECKMEEVKRSDTMDVDQGIEHAELHRCHYACHDSCA